MPKYGNAIIVVMNEAQSGTSAIDYEQLRLYESEYWSVYLHKSQVYLGRTYAALHREGDLDPFTATTDAEFSEFREIARLVMKVTDTLYQPTKYNHLNLRNEWPHCHWHTIPRYDSPRYVLGQQFIDNRFGKNPSPYDRTFQPSDNVRAKIINDFRLGFTALAR